MSKNISIGRGKDCDVVINDPYESISRRHLVLSFNLRGEILAHDTSSNGTFINGEKMKKGVPRKVTRNDKILLGNGIELNWDSVPDPIQKQRKIITGIAVSVLILALAFLIFCLFIGKEEEDSIKPAENFIEESIVVRTQEDVISGEPDKTELTEPQNNDAESRESSEISHQVKSERKNKDLNRVNNNRKSTGSSSKNEKSENNKNNISEKESPEANEPVMRTNQGGFSKEKE